MEEKKIYSNIIAQVTQFSIFIAAFFLPIKTSISNMGLLALLFTSMFSFFIYGVNLKKIILKKFFLTSPFILFTPILIGAFYSPLFAEAQEEVSKYLLLLLIPTFILRKDLQNLEIKASLQSGLIVGSVLSSLVLTISNICKFYFSGLPLVKYLSSHFTGYKFLEPLGSHLHPIYVGSYFVIALSFILLTKNPVLKRFKAIATIILVIAIISLNSRIIFLNTLILMFLVALENLSWKVFAVLITSLIIGASLIMPFFQKTYVYNKLVNGTVWELNENIGTHNTDTNATSDSRMSRWIVGWELVKEKPFFGYGSGMENEMLLQKFKENNMKLSIEKGYNSHNQFLGFLIRFGIMGALVLLVYLGSNIFIAFKNRDLVYFSFVLFIGMIFLIENYLDRNMGINSIVLLGSIFLIKEDV